MECVVYISLYPTEKQNWDPAASVALMPAENKTTSGDTWHAEHMVWAFGKATSDSIGSTWFNLENSHGSEPGLRFPLKKHSTSGKNLGFHSDFKGHV